MPRNSYPSRSPGARRRRRDPEDQEPAQRSSSAPAPLGSPDPSYTHPTSQGEFTVDVGETATGQWRTELRWSFTPQQRSNAISTEGLEGSHESTTTERPPQRQGPVPEWPLLSRARQTYNRLLLEKERTPSPQPSPPREDIRDREDEEYVLRRLLERASLRPRRRSSEEGMPLLFGSQYGAPLPHSPERPPVPENPVYVRFALLGTAWPLLAILTLVYVLVYKL
ncbi:uncharacterized protein EI97DRAFT_131389 [Westerdykella ornata]|uniref:Uncharacterized protein n=1 Tax=Westerdykella ornata TaxID=318751 RepID=A0A6A6JD74_WESOR|nr:uncharacterized protein EI97DRAFT_131389 [Westerdykella ornata]KAF2274215.1 hypothetical protein EI97DRAFT_131389 [Westerdykella ornata]